MNKGFVSFVGYVKKADGKSYVVKHLELAIAENDVHWKYPVSGDTQIINHDQIMPWKVQGDWDLTVSMCAMKFIFKNFIQIRDTFHKQSQIF